MHVDLRLFPLPAGRDDRSEAPAGGAVHAAAMWRDRSGGGAEVDASSVACAERCGGLQYPLAAAGHRPSGPEGAPLVRIHPLPTTAAVVPHRGSRVHLKMRL